MKLFNRLILALGITCCFSACTADKLDVWSEKGRVWFTSVKDTVASFKKYPVADTEMLVSIPISLAGPVADQDREINVIVTKDKRNSQTQYEIQRPVYIKAGATSGLLNIKVNKTENLALLADTLNLGIRSSSVLEAGIVKNLDRIVILTNKYNKPWWWYDFRMGIWSEAKHQTMIDALGSDDDVRGQGAESNYLRGWTHADALYNIYLLNKYCETHNLPYRFMDGR